MKLAEAPLFCFLRDYFMKSTLLKKKLTKAELSFDSIGKKFHPDKNDSKKCNDKWNIDAVGRIKLVIKLKYNEKQSESFVKYEVDKKFFLLRFRSSWSAVKFC